MEGSGLRVEDLGFRVRFGVQVLGVGGFGHSGQPLGLFAYLPGLVDVVFRPIVA